MHPYIYLIVGFIATDTEGVKQIHEPKVVLCACENSGQCDYRDLVQHVPTGDSVVKGFLYAGCKCRAGRDGPFCEDDFAGCDEQHCFTSE